MSRARRIFSTISFGLIFIVLYLWVLVQSDTFFPSKTWTTKIIIMVILLAFPFAWETKKSIQTESKLMRLSAVSQLPKIIGITAVSMIFFVGLGYLIKPEALSSVRDAISHLNLGVLILVLFLFAMTEEFFFRGWVWDRLKEGGMSFFMIALLSTILFALFHYSTSGGNIAVLLTYIPLSYLFIYVKLNGIPLLNKMSPAIFGNSIVTNAGNSAMHFAYNLFVLGFLGAGL